MSVTTIAQATSQAEYQRAAAQLEGSDCLHCEKRPRLPGRRLCERCRSQRKIRRIYRRTHPTRSWDLHLQVLCNRARLRKPLFRDEELEATIRPLTAPNQKDVGVEIKSHQESPGRVRNTSPARFWRWINRQPSPQE